MSSGRMSSNSSSEFHQILNRIPEKKFKRTILITGSTNGIGFESAIKLASMTDENFVLFHAKDNKSLLKICEHMSFLVNQKSTGFTNFGAIVADFGDLKQVNQMADKIMKNYPKLNTLILNAGVLNDTRKNTVDKLESMFQVNYLANYLLIQKLLPFLQKNAPCRILHISCVCHWWQKIDWDDLQAQKKFEMYEQYCRTKLMNILFAFKLARICKDSGIVNLSLQPAIFISKLTAIDGFEEGISPENPIIYTPLIKIATEDKFADLNGHFFNKYLQSKQPSNDANSIEYQDKLWNISHEICRRLKLIN